MRGGEKGRGNIRCSSMGCWETDCLFPARELMILENMSAFP